MEVGSKKLAGPSVIDCGRVRVGQLLLRPRSAPSQHSIPGLRFASDTTCEASIPTWLLGLCWRLMANCMLCHLTGILVGEEGPLVAYNVGTRNYVPHPLRFTSLPPEELHVIRISQPRSVMACQRRANPIDIYR
jgi:hypothetical protein